MLRATLETESMEGDIQDRIDLDDGDPGFRFLTEGKVAAVSHFNYFHYQFFEILEY
jgi:hypothetical protein